MKSPLHGSAILLTLSLGLLLPGASGCARRAEAVPETPSTAAAPAVRTVTPVRKTLRRFLDQPGYVEAFEETPIHVKLAGYVKKLHKDIGDPVRAGDLLAELAVPELEEEFKHKEALVEQAQAEVVQAQEAVKVGEASVATSQIHVKEMEAGRPRAVANYDRFHSEHQRVQGMVARKVIDQQVGDEALNQLRAAESSREEVEAKVHSAQAACLECTAKLAKMRADVLASQARLRVARADALRVKALLDYTRVQAPFDGVVTRRTVFTGQFLQPPGGGAKAEPLFVVVRADPVRVFVDVPEADAVRVRPGAATRVRIQGLHDEEFTGPVTRTAWALNRQERTLRTEIDLPNPTGKLRPGMYAHARIAVEHPQAWTLPAGALMTFDARDYCFLLEDGKAKRVALRVGSREGDTVEVLKKQHGSSRPGEETWDDFTGTETVITSNPRALTDGQPIGPAPK
jgi:HlyD family secretion protein